MTLTVVTWLWKSKSWRAGQYSARHVNACQRMVAANLNIDHRFVCVTDDAAGIECETIPLWDFPVVPTRPDRPNCYRRLYAFSDHASALFGPRFVSVDIDCLIMPGTDGHGITPLLDRPEDFLIVNGWRDNQGCCPYNGSMWMMDAGARAKVWTEFDPARSPEIARQNKMPNGKPYYGSDQAWIGHSIPGEKVWCRDDGIYSYVRDMGQRDEIPKECRIMFFPGSRKPWQDFMRRVHPSIWQEYQKYL